MRPSPLPDAATPEEAVEQAKDVHGPDVLIEAVRPVRTGGILGFFATERYQAEVATPEPAHAEESPVTDMDLSTALDDLDSLFSSDTVPGEVTYRAVQVRPAAAIKEPLPVAARPALVAVAPPTVSATAAAPAKPGTEKPSAAPVSPFAAALARVSSTPEVAHAVEAVVAEAAPARRAAYPLSAALVADRGEVAAPTGPVPFEAATHPATVVDPFAGQHPDDPEHLLARLAALGVPAGFVPEVFLRQVAERGTHAALTTLLRMRLPKAPVLPVEPGTVVVVGPGAEALEAAGTVADMLRVSASRIRWAAPEALSPLATSALRIKSIEEAHGWAGQSSKASSKTNIVAVNAPLSESTAAWTAQMVTALRPDVVLAVVDATRKPGDVDRWLNRVPSVDGLLLHSVADSADPATFLLPSAPVLMIDGKKATAPAWASLLCERLAETEGR